jgi:2-oxoglutarate dehydrogenase E2 component (dihydrolipoamide succinyltransferase)
MAEIRVPTLGESVTEATVSRWLKQKGDAVGMDEALVELETDKVTLEVNATTAGILGEISVAEGATVNVGALLGEISEGGAPAAKPAASAPKPATAPAPTPAPQAAQAAVDPSKSGPAARKLVEDNKLVAAQIPATGKDGRLTKGDVLAAVAVPVPASPALAAASGPKPVAAP